jgi:ubiquitin-protein ligase
MMADRILEGFLSRQYEAGMQLAHQSDLLDLIPLGVSPPNRYMAHFTCRGLIRTIQGAILEAHDFAVEIRFPQDYLRSRDPHLPYRVLTWLLPRRIWHPNISNEHPIICVGRLSPGTNLVAILYQLFEIITYNKVTMVETDALNKEACAWARRNVQRFPIDQRSLKRESLNLSFKFQEKLVQP